MGWDGCVIWVWGGWGVWGGVGGGGGEKKKMCDIAVKLYEDATAAQRRAGDQDG